MRGVLLRTFDVAAVCWLSLIGGLLLWADAPMAWGWQPRVVLSGSMTPALQPGDVVLTAPVAHVATVPLGQIIAVADPAITSGSFLHRIVAREPDGRVLTRGDANRSNDFPAVSDSRALGRVAMVVPKIGRPLVWFRSGTLWPLISIGCLTAFSALYAVGRSGLTPAGLWLDVLTGRLATGGVSSARHGSGRRRSRERRRR